MFWIAHNFSDRLFHKQHDFSENEPSGASTPTKGTRNLNLWALMNFLHLQNVRLQNFKMPQNSKIAYNFTGPIKLQQKTHVCIHASIKINLLESNTAWKIKRKITNYSFEHAAKQRFGTLFCSTQYEWKAFCVYLFSLMDITNCNFEHAA
jgi:hypothetical protein